MANQVTLTFAGDAAPLSSTFAGIGADAEKMADRTHASSERMAEGFDHVSSQSSLLSGGIGDIGGALTEAFGEDSGIGKVGAEMERYSAIVTGVTGASDLLLFATNNLKLATFAKAVADRAATAAQWLMNTAMLASPVTWIALAIVALIAIIVLIATKTDWFSRAWRASWDWIKRAASNTWDFLKKIPGWIGTAFAKVADFIIAPYRFAFNQIAKLWNNTIGQLSWTVPDWIPFIGGKTISVPHLPTFHSGGIVPGPIGQPVPIMALGGERFAGGAGSNRGDDGGWIKIDLGDLGDALLRSINKAVTAKGGQASHLGIRVLSDGTVRA